MDGFFWTKQAIKGSRGQRGQPLIRWLGESAALGILRNLEIPIVRSGQRYVCASIHQCLSEWQKHAAIIFFFFFLPHLETSALRRFVSLNERFSDGPIDSRSDGWRASSVTAALSLVLLVILQHPILTDPVCVCSCVWLNINISWSKVIKNVFSPCRCFWWCLLTNKRTLK